MFQRPIHPSARIRALLAATLTLALAACASAPPAPIVARTGAGARPPGAPAPAAPAAPAVVTPAPTPPAPEVTVQTAPIRSGTVESRGIESRPLDARPPTGAPGAPGALPPGALPPGALPPGAVAPAVPTLPPNTRTAPRGTKVPYSDSALAELRAAEAGAPAPTAPAPAAPAGSPAAAPLPATPPSAAAPPAADGRSGDADGDWAWPSPGKVMQSFTESGNKGVVLGGRVGDPVVAAADGRVIFSGNGPRGYGNLVIVKHANELLSVYAHNRTLAVKEGQAVKRGQKIAELGDSGTSSPRLHFEIRQQGKPVDPTRFLPKR
ncbi:MAG: peptidase M23 [Burkholderiales bacterium]|nr:MAG: peptidase M23 [Burkholderiales bacterium]